MNISELIQVLSQYSWVLAPISIILAIIFYLKSKRKKSIKYSLRNDILIKNFEQKVEGLNISFYEKKIKTLSVAKIVFWNDGTETISRDDIPKNNIFSISINNDYQILDVSLIQVINKVNDINIEFIKENKLVKIYFEYIDKNEGFIIQLFHTDIDVKNIIINGSIKGFGDIKKGKTNNDHPIHFIIKNFLFPLAGLIVFLIDYLFSFNMNTALIVILMIILWLSFAYINYKIARSVPKKMKMFFEEF